MFVVPSLIAMITTIGVMIVTYFLLPANVNKVRSISYWFRRHHLADLHRQGRTGINCRHLPATIVLAIGIWAYQIPFAGSRRCSTLRW